ncbi:DUF2924 domain-containing protein [Myxococcus llanfairpwllgwyngyllgogerychwyrndrobwllllantysiliogogogochensis]|uniref:DUF2924 domain-containing protein n=1 Tax=Myxococcus llanfairpwllgwyngyllgogerychwyrndrobwllllantysiliogogogochensis TaxID=2590453 RepID=A0A540WNM7_9BACT|nr:DUF2924 domain-containing protein [Myxococcus llanfairpwllgwyngyllgogerychwyrndrobwllllantysiliogogogochensis]TQF10437.1 DUF2924 domain-containing protein [Myxococcus llanfairpwllgwyngyllgogerychwyrndrobwllllantysiliogogogochensis]
MAKRGTVRAARKQLADVPQQLAALAQMRVPELAKKYQELYGEPTRSRNAPHLRKRLAFRIQELAEGGLSPRAVARIAELGDTLPESWRMRQAEVDKNPAGPLPAVPDDRDARLPPPGTVLTRVYRGTELRVTVREGSFEYEGKLHRSLSSIAKLVTGTAWNGFTFFGLKAGSSKAVKS